MPTLLALDTALGGCSVALVAGEAGSARVLAHRFEARSRGHAERLVPMIAEVLEETGKEFADLDRLAVTVGPGTFTGLRVGVATVRGLSLASGLPVVPVNTLEAIRANVSAEDIDGFDAVAVVIDAKREEVYLQVFTPAGAPLSEPALVSVGDLATAVPGEKVLAVGSGAHVLAGTVPGDRSVVISTSSVQPDAARFAPSLVGREPSDGPPAPLYLRRPDAKLPARLGVERR